MYISRVTIKNFANFKNLDVSTCENLVIVGENKVGKSNFIFALRLLLDPGLSERDRQLGFEHFWDGLDDSKLGQTVEISLELSDFASNDDLVAHLGDCLVASTPEMVARLTYRFQPKAELEGQPKSVGDYEYLIFGGTDPDNAVSSNLRRMVPMDVLEALRDAEKELANWRRSPLRPLVTSMAAQLTANEIDGITGSVDTAQEALAKNVQVKKLALTITKRLKRIVGTQHSTNVAMGLAPTAIDALLRSLRLLIDGGGRGIEEASLGTANLIYLTLKSLELDRLVDEGERDHTFLAVEEPEAHLHPHVQRLVYRHFLRSFGVAKSGGDKPPVLNTILTTHSPHIASVAPLRSIVLLKKSSQENATIAVSTAKAKLSAREVNDLQRYIDVTRGELFFARSVILVEGDAELFLIPAFADALGVPLDELGVSVCSVGGTNFAPYVKLLGQTSLQIPHVVLTDLDPVPGKKSYARKRILSLLKIVAPAEDHDQSSEMALFKRAEKAGFFVNADTLEPGLFRAGLAKSMRRIIVRELPNLKAARKQELEAWEENPGTVDPAALVRHIERIGKGRFAQLLSNHVDASTCPEYIRSALQRVKDHAA